MEKIRILIIEDTESDIQTYQDTIKTVNMDLIPDYEILATYAKNKKQGLEELEKLKDELHGAFIDLRLQSGSSIDDINEGNELVDKIYNKLRFPVTVLTNTPGAFDSKFKKSLFLNLKTKTDVEYSEIFNDLIAIHKTGIVKILGRKSKIEEMLDKIFWNNISVTLPEWIGIDNSEKHLLRYILTHFQEHLEISDDGSEFDKVYPIENYIKPSIKEYFFTGDIICKISDKSKRFVILTPACDLAPHGEHKIPKSKEILLAEIQDLVEEPLSGKVRTAKKILTLQNRDEINDAKSEIIKIIANNYSPKYYFLPETNDIKGGLVNFQKLSTVKLKGLNNDYEKEATITSQFSKDIIAKFSYYYSRQGSPDFDFDNQLQTLLK